jgi:hypothetical protein
MMDERQVIALTFGGSLDRESGIMAAAPGSMRDLRNVIIRQGRVDARPGVELITTFQDDEARPMSHIIELHPFLTEGAAMVVGYVEETRKVWVFRTTGDGLFPTALGVWFELAAGLELPRVILAECKGRMFFAHAEPIEPLRAPTIYYDPTGAGTLQELKVTWRDTSDPLDGTLDEEQVYFRGVRSHLESYLVGYGWAGFDQYGPQMVRTSLPGEPLVFEKNHYEWGGARGNACTAMVPTPWGTMAVFRENATDEIIGRSRKDFGRKETDPNHGCVGDRLAIAAEGMVFFWSETGPRALSGSAPSQDIALPLDLAGPSPAELVADGSIYGAFASYDAEARTVEFHFGRRSYVLSFRQGEPQWSYNERGIEPYCAAVLQAETDVATGPPAGYVEILEVDQVGETSVRLRLKNHGLLGGEYTEVWLRHSLGVWGLKMAVRAGGELQDVIVSDLNLGTFHEVAVQLRRAGVHAPGYGPDPDIWTAATAEESISDFTTIILAPIGLVGTWTRTSSSTEKIALAWTVRHPSLRTKVFRVDASDVEAELADLDPGVAGFDDLAIDTGLFHTYRVRYYTVDTQGENASVVTYAGPPVLQLNAMHASSFYVLPYWTDVGFAGEIEFNCNLRTGAVLKSATWDVGMSMIDYDAPVPAGTAITLVGRYTVEAFGVRDYGAWSHILSGETSA